MKTRATRFVIGAAVATVVVLLCAYIGYSTFAYSGSKALPRITAEEQPYLIKYNQLQRGMTHDQVRAILGESDRNELGLRPTWRVNDSSINQIAVYFQGDRLRKVRWLHIGRFIMEK